MKKILLVGCLLLASAFGFAQEQQQPLTENVKVKEVEVEKSHNFYIGTSLSMGTNDDYNFREFSYASVTGGYCIGDVALQASVGRGNLVDVGKENIENYWYEGSVVLSNTESKRFQPYIILGLGSYVDSSHVFTEYGFGTALKLGRFSPSIQASSWDNDWYISPGISYSL